MSKPQQFGFFSSEKANRSAGGRLAKARGQWFEKELEMANSVYRASGLALIERVHPPVVGAPGAMRPSGSGPVDFLGVLRGGRSVIFDAKSRDNPASFAYDPRDQHQIDALVDADALGALAFLLIADSSRSLAYVVRGREALRSLQRGGRIPLRDRANAPMQPVVPCRTSIQRGRPTVWDYLAIVEPSCRTIPTSPAAPTAPVAPLSKP